MAQAPRFGNAVAPPTASEWPIKGQGAFPDRSAWKRALAIWHIEKGPLLF